MTDCGTNPRSTVRIRPKKPAMCDAGAKEIPVPDRVPSLWHASLYEPQRYRHIVTSVITRELSGGRATSIAHFLVVRTLQGCEALLFASGTDCDVICLQPAPHHEERGVMCDSRRFDTLLAIPL